MIMQKVKVKTPLEELESIVKAMVDNGGDLGVDFPALKKHIEKLKEKEKAQSLELIELTAQLTGVASVDEEIGKMKYEDVYEQYYGTLPPKYPKGIKTITCDFCKEVTPIWSAIDVWAIKDDGRNQCYRCQQEEKEKLRLHISKIKAGDKVHYIPDHKWSIKDGKFYEQDDKFENGIIKEIPENYSGCVRVVFHCAGEWENYMNYTSQLTPLKNLRLGWK